MRVVYAVTSDLSYEEAMFVRVQYLLDERITQESWTPIHTVKDTPPPLNIMWQRLLNHLVGSEDKMMLLSVETYPMLNRIHPEPDNWTSYLFYLDELKKWHQIGAEVVPGRYTLLLGIDPWF